MAGLLYKDFVGIKGRRLLWLLAGCTLIFLILRFLFPGNSDEVMSGIMTENEAGELIRLTVGDFRDSLLVMLPMLFIVCGFFLPSTWTAAICRHDEKNKTRQYTRTLPLDKNAYIASKYLFIGIGVYLLFSLDNIWIIIFNSVAGNNNSTECLMVLSQFLMGFCGLSLVLASIELPFFITFGVKKGMLVKTAILEIAAFFVMAYLFFGNLKIFENFNIYTFINWCENHLAAITFISILSPVAELLIFWLSYRITCRINRNREVESNG